MTPILAIARLALRNALRSRVLLTLFALLFASSFLLPLAIRSDGTPEGLIRLHLTYTLGIASFLLGLATLWGGAAAISREAVDKTLQLLLVKPVPRHHIWLGKWIALLLINACLLALVGAATALTLREKLRGARFDPAALDLARHTTLNALDTLRSPLPDIEDTVRAELDTLRSQNRLPPGMPDDVVLDNLRRHHLARLYSIPPGESRSWTFDRPAGAPALAASPFAQFRCDASVPGATRIGATLRLETGPLSLDRTSAVIPGTLHTVLFDDLPAGASFPLTLTFTNHGTHDAALFFDPADGLILRLPRGAFAANYLRALAQLYLRLALFAAIGVTLGTLFSMPVATFLTLVLLLILQLGGFVSAAAQVDRATFVDRVAPFGADAHSHGHDGDSPAPPPPSFAARAAATFLFYAYRATWLTLRPLLENQTLDRLSTGTRIPPRELLRDLLRQALLLPAALALLSTLVLKKREWALPSLP